MLMDVSQDRPRSRLGTDRVRKQSGAYLSGAFEAIIDFAEA